MLADLGGELGILFGALMLVGATLLAVYLFRRFPSDLENLRERYEDFKTRNGPTVLAKMKHEDVRRSYQARCVMEFRTAVILCALFWVFLIPASLCVFVVGVFVFKAGLWSAFNG